MIRASLLVSVLIAAETPAIAGSGGLTLVQDARATCAIVIAPDATDDEKTAAADLSLYLGKMAGAKPPVGADASITGNRILIGVFGRLPVADWKGQPPGHDAFAIETREREGGGTDLFLVGGDPRGAAYAVYELLERFLGVRWYMPTELGEEVPTRKTISLENLKWSNKPDYEAVSGLTWHGGPGAADWLRRNKGDVGSPTYFFGHSWQGYVSPSEENMKAHPDWFALMKDGKRSDQVCTSHPEVIQIFIDNVTEYFDKHPEAMLASISPNDGHGHTFCTCERCRAIDAQYGVTDGTQTDRFIHFANVILKEVKKKHPAKLVGILAYVTHTRPPVSAMPDDNYSTIICHTPWDFCHVHPIDDPACKLNLKFREMIDGWTKVCKHVSVYDYYGHYSVMTPWPILHNIRRDLPYYRSRGVAGFMSETQQHWANQGLNFYLTAKLVWDADRDAGAILDEFYQNFYGPAVEPMKKYWEAWEAAMAAQQCGGFRWLEMFTPDLIQQCGLLLDEAERLAGGNEKLQARLTLHRIGHRFTDAYARMLRYTDAGNMELGLAAGNEAIRIVEASLGTEPQAFWVRLSSDQTGIQVIKRMKKLAASRPAQERAPGEVTTNSRDGAEMVYVPAGEFLMGSREGEASPNETPQRRVYLDDYWIYRTPVTVSQYRKFCESTGRKPPEPQHASKEDHPVVNVSWEDASAYAQWAGASLPTEAQWEKAARGSDGRIYPWGDSINTVKRRKAVLNDEEQTRPVESHPEVSSPYGVQDMVGNVWQWCSDWYDPDYYRTAPVRNPTGPETGTSRVLRGGRWFINDPNFFPAAYRNFYLPKRWIGFCGFRCVVTPPEKES